jgi:stage II sporulation protein D
VNVLPLEDYLKGVVPNELPVRFGLEALKAQAVAARNYTIRPRTRVYHNFDVCDSVQCQVYFGANTEHPLSNKAIEETKVCMRFITEI